MRAKVGYPLVPVSRKRTLSSHIWESGLGLCPSGWSTSPSGGSCTPPPRTTTCTSTSSRRARPTRIRNKRVNEDTGDEVAYEDIVKGAELNDGGYVMLTQEELESVEPGKSRTIDISDFVDASEIDPIYYQKSYYLAPSDDSAKKAYVLLLKAMDKAERIGVATFVMRGKQYLAADPAVGRRAVLETMYFADEVRDPADELDQLPTRTKVGGKDLDMAVNLVEAMTSPWDPKNYRDTYTDECRSSSTPRSRTGRSSSRRTVRLTTPRSSTSSLHCRPPSIPARATSPATPATSPS